MASDSNLPFLWVFTFVLFFSHASLDFSSASPQTEKTLPVHLVKGLSRSRRQECAHGDYRHEGRTCCMCGPGLRLTTHCSVNQNDGQCESCATGTYSSHPNSQESCEPCTSCGQPDANLEEEESCTRARNTKCRCKKGHYCSTSTEKCLLCHLCKECGSDGVRVACTATNDTVCHDKSEGGNAGIIAGIIVPLVLSALIGVAVWCCRRRNRKQYTPGQPNGNAQTVELQTLNELQSKHMPDIAAALGWKNMRDVAMRSGMTTVEIDSCKQSAPTDPEEMTLQLLSKWIEKEGRGAATRLITLLEKNHKRDKAERVAEILRRGDAPV
ncbi:tumor necrosis factor receptor superfamily member 6 isoform X2 [Paralichthys olivaceus]|uniref:tumor necrosis factor receptor superfamily member 6 isoform X2 n=1 Tax=Paralichthys olivaceus TaxID=8255 RepID=UPI0037538720